ILEDTKGNGTFDKKTVFAEGLSLVSGIETGFGGVWVGAAPYMMFIADKNRDDKPDADPVPHPVQGLKFQAEILLDGWGSQDTHETLNSFIWGPDGWLYGCQGVFTYSNVGKPGATDKERTPLNCCVWRYHPVRHEFEVFAHGTSNPWGLDYDQYGEFFVTACVIPHLYHIVPGARYQRQGGQHYNPYTYEDIKTIADHAHYAGNIRDNAHWGTRDAGAIVGDETNEVGGGHAHCGLAIYQSNLFPQTYRNSLIFGNLHGHRLVSDYVEPKGSTYVGKHGSDFMRSNDMNFIPVTQKVGPDGALYVSDWSDKQVCHRGTNAVGLWDRSNGRIYRISYDGWKPWKGDLWKESDEALVKLAVQTKNEWLSRMARRVLMERAGDDNHLLYDWTAKKNVDMPTPLNRLIFSLADSVHNTTTEQSKELRALWTLYAVGGYVGIGGENYTGWHNDSARVWAIRLMTSGWSATKPIQRFISTATEPLPSNTDPKSMPPGGALFDVTDFAEHTKNEKSPMVRREIASMLQNMPVTRRSEIATALLKHGEDKDDPYIPLLIWYGIEPLVGADPKVGLELAKVSKFDKITGFIYRRMGAEEAGRTGLIMLAAETQDGAHRETLLKTVIEAARAGNKIALPANWAELKAKMISTKVEATLTELEAFMGVPEAKQAFRAQLADKALPSKQRDAVLTLLMSVRDADTAPLLQEIIRSDDKALTHHAVQGLATLSHPGTPALLIGKLGSFDAATKNEAINTLATNATGAKLLLTAVKKREVPMTMLSPFLARQMDSLKDEGVKGLLKEVWGDLNAPKADLPERKAKFRSLLTPAALAKADAAKGRVMFNAICGQCHKLFGEGQNVGPDLTGSNRANLDYLLDNVLDPNAVIGKAYQLNIFELKDGRIASGVIKEETPAVYRIAMPGGFEQTLTVAEVRKRTVSPVSTMPEGLFEAMPKEQLIELVAYLQSHASEPAKAGAVVKIDGAIEGEDLKVLEVKGGNAKVQGMGGFGSLWSGAKQLWWTGAKPGATLTLELLVAEKDKYQLFGAVTQAKDYGIIDVSLDGKVVAANYDCFNGPKVIHSAELDWGAHNLDKGAHKLTFTIKGSNPKAVKSYMLGLDYVRLVKK
ncbi:MAG: putative rane-bound dehydrogenase domain protein, partial [Verrucomicrobiaceae bacterium]|nr:putative rane-bound dehydrogenase domain protein [Verrucomicrobiaceae bacterium]